MATKKQNTSPPPICMHENVKVGTDEIVVCVDCGEVQEFPSEAAATKPMALAVVESQPLQEIAPTGDAQQTVDPYYGIAARPFDEHAQEVLRRPVDPALISFRPDGLAYVPIVHFRDALNEAFRRGGWGIKPLAPPLIKDNKVYYHGGLYVSGRFVTEGLGTAEYFPQNPDADWGSAWESARSDAVSRCCKDLGIYDEIRDPKYLEPLKQQWQDKERPYCPSCGKPENVRHWKDGNWSCWQKKGGCGWSGTEPRRGTQGSQPEQVAAQVPRQAPAAPRPKAPEPQDPTGKPFPELMNRITALLNKMDSAQREVWQGWLATHDSASDWKRALDKIEARMKAEVAK